MPSVFFCSQVLWLCCYTQSKDLHLTSHKVLLCLRVLASVVVVTEECKNTDDQTHYHKQCQDNPEKSPTQGNLGTKLTDKNQDLFHPPVKKIISDICIAISSFMCLLGLELEMTDITDSTIYFSCVFYPSWTIINHFM